MWAEFKTFLTKTNALALAVGVIIGVALGNVVSSLVNDIIMPPIGVLLGGVDFSNFVMKLKDATATAAEVDIRWGAFINWIIIFVVVAFVVFMIARMLIKEPKAAPAPEMKTCPYCKEDVPAAATKCRYCTSQL